LVRGAKSVDSRPGCNAFLRLFQHQLSLTVTTTSTNEEQFFMCIPAEGDSETYSEEPESLAVDLAELTPLAKETITKKPPIISIEREGDCLICDLGDVKYAVRVKQTEPEDAALGVRDR
jgi:hypothetical protein